MIAKIKAYWRSKASNIHGLVLFLGGSSGLAALHQIGIGDKPANVIFVIAIVAGALLFTPPQSQ